MFKKYAILMLGLVLAGAQINAMGSLRQIAKPALIGAMALQVNMLRCDEQDETYSYEERMRIEYTLRDQRNANKNVFPKKSEYSNYPELAKFISRYRCSKELEADPKDHYLKSNAVDRLVNAERLKELIKQENLDHLKVADKCLCKRDATTFFLLSKRLDFKNERRTYAGNRAMLDQFSLAEVQQLTKVAEIAAYTDWPSNVNKTTDDKIAFFDTERFSFWSGDRRLDADLTTIAKPRAKYKVIRHLGTYFDDYMQPDAQVWFTEKLKTVSQDKQTKIVPLQSNPAYDKQIGIDFERVKAELMGHREKIVSEEIEKLKYKIKQSKMEELQRQASFFSKCYWRKSYCH